MSKITHNTSALLTLTRFPQIILESFTPVEAPRSIKVDFHRRLVAFTKVSLHPNRRTYVCCRISYYASNLFFSALCFSLKYCCY